MAIVIRVAMIAMTTISSNKVKPFCRRICSPLPIGDAIEPLAASLGVNVKDVLALARVLSRTVIGTQAPAALVVTLDGGQRITGDAPQEIELGPLGAAHVTYTIDQHFQVRRVAVAVERLLDVTGVEGAFIGVDAIADLVQRVPQFLLFAPTHHRLGQRCGHAGQQADQGKRHHDFDQGKTALRGVHDHGFPTVTVVAIGAFMGPVWTVVFIERSGAWMCMLVSVPVGNSMSDGLWYGRLRTIRGVIDSTSSDLLTSSLLLPNRRPRPGMSPRPGILLPLLPWSLRTRPARIWVSPSCRRKVVWALRVSTWTGMVP